MHNPRLQHLLALTAGALFVACGGADGSSLLDGDSGAANDATTVPDGSVTQDAGADVVTLDASTKDSAMVKDTGTPYVDPGITCGTADCDAGAELCCVSITSYYPTYTYSFACEQTTDLVQCAAGIPIYCDDDHQCTGGQVCCGDLGNPTYAKVSCKATCTGFVFGYEQIHFCNPNASDCGTGQSCKPSTVITGYYVCQ